MSTVRGFMFPKVGGRLAANKTDQLRRKMYLPLPSASTGGGGKGGASRSFSAPSSAYLAAGEKENFLEAAARIMTERPRPIPAWICRESIVCFCFSLERGML